MSQNNELNSKYVATDIHFHKLSITMYHYIHTVVKYTS